MKFKNIFSDIIDNNFSKIKLNKQDLIKQADYLLMKHLEDETISKISDPLFYYELAHKTFFIGVFFDDKILIKNSLNNIDTFLKNIRHDLIKFEKQYQKKKRLEMQKRVEN